MKREKFLWPLTQGHHGALLAARNIRDRLSRLEETDARALEALSREVQTFFEMDLEKHFQGEEKELLGLFEAHVKPDDLGIQKLRSDHLILRNLAKTKTRNELQLFADTLTAHIRFEEEDLFPRIEKTLNEEEKSIEAESLLLYKPSETHVPLPFKNSL